MNEVEIKLYILTYTDGEEDFICKIHAPNLEIAREHAEMSEVIADLEFVSAEETEPLKHNITE